MGPGEEYKGAKLNVFSHFRLEGREDQSLCLFLRYAYMDRMSSNGEDLPLKDFLLQERRRRRKFTVSIQPAKAC